MRISDPRGPGTNGLPAQWTRVDEWYDFTSNPRPNVNVLATVDESTYDAGPDAMGADHPITWWHDYDGGRSWYTAMGHTSDSYAEPLFLQLILGGIMYAAAPPEAPATPSPPRITALSTAVRAGRVTVTVTSRTATRCTASATITLRVRRRITPLRVTGTTARGTTAALPTGRWLLVVSVADSASGLTRTARRYVRIG